MPDGVIDETAVKRAVLRQDVFFLVRKMKVQSDECACHKCVGKWEVDLDSIIGKVEQWVKNQNT